MIRENQKIFNTTQIVADIVIFLASMVGAFYLRFINYEGYHIEFIFYWKLSLMAIPLYLLIFNYFMLYESYRAKRLMLEINRIIKANLLGIILVVILSFLVKEVNVSRMVILLFGLLNTFLMLLSRLALRKILRAMRRNGYNIKKMLIIGSGELADEFIDKITKNKNLGYKIVANIGEQFAILEDMLTNDTIDEVVVALEYNKYSHLPDIIESCEKAGTKVSVIPFYTKYLPARPYIDELEGLPVINIRRIPLDNLINNLSKRLFDFFAAFFILVLLMPLLIIVALGVKMTSPGPVIYRQQRVGLDKKDFLMYKFRSMRVTNDASDKTAWSTKNDPRKTSFGSFIRKYSIDELPQLFNVMIGDMSLVGPRPEIPFHVNNFKEEIPLYMVKHQVRPGITGWAQVNGFRGDTSIPARIQHDIFYIENWTFLLDIKILFMTVFKGLVSDSE